MSSMVCAESWERQPSISCSDRRKEGGFHLSNFSEISRRAVSPRLSISSIMPVTMSRTFLASAVACSGGRPVFRYRAILPSSHSSQPLRKLADSGYRLTQFDVAGGSAMLFGCIAGLVIRFDRFRCGRKNREVPPADNLGCGNGDISRDRHLDQSWRFRVERSLDIRADIIHRLHFGCDFKAK